MGIGVLVGGRWCQCCAVRAGVRLATVRWCRLHWSSATAAQNQTPAALPLCQVSPIILIILIIPNCWVDKNRQQNTTLSFHRLPGVF